MLLLEIMRCCKLAVTSHTYAPASDSLSEENERDDPVSGSVMFPFIHAYVKLKSTALLKMILQMRE